MIRSLSTQIAILSRAPRRALGRASEPLAPIGVGAGAELSGVRRSPAERNSRQELPGAPPRQRDDWVAKRAPATTIPYSLY